MRHFSVYGGRLSGVGLVCAALLLGRAVPVIAQQSMPRLAPGVLNVVPAAPEEAETVTGPRQLHALAQSAPSWKPHFSPENETLSELANQVTLRRPVWQLEFAFKPMRMLTLDDADGQRQRVWYLLYRVRNAGGYLKAVPQQDEFGNTQFVTAKGSRTLRFLPMFVLRCHEFNKSYSDRLIPGVIDRIHQIEIRDPQVQLHDSVSITKVALAPSTETVDRSVWGVATWLAVDRRTDFFSVFVQGLSNAYRWDDGPDQKPLLTFKTLQVNFWRPSDPVFENQREFRYGLPSLPAEDARNASVLEMYGLSHPVDYSWVYLP